MPHEKAPGALPADVDVADILAAMRQGGAYLDISPEDALELYRLAYGHALARLRQGHPVRELMTQAVIMADPDETALAAVTAMADAGVSGLPVVAGGAVVGVLSAKDVLTRLHLPAEATTAALLAHLLAGDVPAVDEVKDCPVRDLMTAPALTVAPETPAAKAAEVMTGRGVNRLPVVEEGRLVGIVSRHDLIGACRRRREGGGA